MIAAMVAGNIGQDAEQKVTSKGDDVVEFSVASSERKDEPATWVRCAMFGKRGPLLKQYLTKGQPVCVTGSLKLREYKAKDGTMKTSADLRVENVKLMGRAQGEGSSKPFAPQQYGASRDDEEIPF